jgi:hypothetical protein
MNDIEECDDCYQPCTLICHCGKKSCDEHSCKCGKFLVGNCNLCIKDSDRINRCSKCTVLRCKDCINKCDCPSTSGTCYICETCDLQTYKCESCKHNCCKNCIFTDHWDERIRDQIFLCYGCQNLVAMN